MTLMQLPAAAGKVLLEDEAFFDLRCIEQPPAGGAVVSRVHGVAQLENQQPLDSFVDPEVVRFGDAHTPVVTDLDQMLVFDGVSQTFFQGV
jgi:hypothetical protein